MTVQDLARRAAFDALALAGPDESGGGYMRTVDDSTLLDPQRLALAREALAIVRRDRLHPTPEVLAELVVPRIRALVQAGVVR